MSTICTNRPAPTLSSTDGNRARHSYRPWYRWLLTALAFPPAGYIAHLVAGRVDSVPAALGNGFIAGAAIALAQWALLRRRGVSLTWVVASAAGLAAGLATGAALVSYRTDRPALVVMGAVSGLAMGLAQVATTANAKRAVVWGAITAALWAVGWIVTDLVINDYVAKQWPVFGISGALTVALVQTTIVGAFVPTAAQLGAAMTNHVHVEYGVSGNSKFANGRVEAATKKVTA